MYNTAFLFAGQGAQYPGMGRGLFDNYASAREVFAMASDIAGRDIARLCFESDDLMLSQTDIAQPALFTLSMAAYAVLSENGLLPNAVAGFSLGECAALCAAGVFSLADGVRLVLARAHTMQQAVERRGGSMYAIIGLEDSIVEAICAQTEGYVLPVNYNCPSQLVIAGEDAACLCAAETCKAAGALKCVRLNVTGAFHSAFMQEAATAFRESIAGIVYYPALIPIYTNVTGGKLDSSISIPDHLARQMTSPVLWSRSISCMQTDGITRLIELGAGKTLCGFAKRISRGLLSSNVEDEAGVLTALSILSA